MLYNFHMAMSVFWGFLLHYIISTLTAAQYKILSYYKRRSSVFKGSINFPRVIQQEKKCFWFPSVDFNILSNTFCTLSMLLHKNVESINLLD